MFTLRQTMLGILFGTMVMPAALAQDYLGVKPYYGVHFEPETGLPMGTVVERRARENGTGIMEFDYRDIQPAVVEQQTIVNPGLTKDETVTKRILVKNPVVRLRNMVAYRPVKWQKVMVRRPVVVSKGVYETKTITKQTVSEEPTIVRRSLMVTRPLALPSDSIIDKPLVEPRF